MPRALSHLATTLTLLCIAPAAHATPPPLTEPEIQLRGVAELGIFSAAAHDVQFGSSGTRFDYVDEGGQDVLFPFARLSIELELNRHHTVTLLYQPFDLRTSVVLGRDVTIDGQLFARDTPLDLRYGFDFWRVSYTYDLFGDKPEHELSFGASLQIRNANIEFTAVDGSARRVNRSLGPVPLLKARGRYAFDNGLWLATEIDGIYAPVKYFNGGNSDVEGALLDLSLRVGFHVTRRVQVFFNLRYLGGGASGTSKDADDRDDGYVSNWLHFFALSVGTIFNPTSGI